MAKKHRKLGGLGWRDPRVAEVERLAKENGLQVVRLRAPGHVKIVGGPSVVQYWAGSLKHCTFIEYIAGSSRQNMTPADAVAMALAEPPAGPRQRMEDDAREHLAAIGREGTSPGHLAGTRDEPGIDGEDVFRGFAEGKVPGAVREPPVAPCPSEPGSVIARMLARLDSLEADVAELRRQMLG